MKNSIKYSIKWNTEGNPFENRKLTDLALRVILGENHGMALESCYCQMYDDFTILYDNETSEKLLTYSMTDDGLEYEVHK